MSVLLTLPLLAITLVVPGKNPKVAPLPRAHAHNDYLHQRPLFDALDHGFVSVEADIFLHKGQLVVAHYFWQIKMENTLEKLYLEPLQKRIRGKNNKVYDDGTQLLLLIDIKNEAEATYRVLHKLLEKYSDLLTRFEGEEAKKGTILVVISGARPREYMRNQKVRYAAYDGRIEDLKGNASANFIPLISASWRDHFRWFGEGPMPADEKKKLLQIVETAHKQGRRVRFWATYDRPDSRRQTLWTELYSAGVDLLNTDDLAGLEKFLRGQK